MTTLLEARYRAVLRLLPAYYRRVREEEMVETYLWDVDQETQDQSRPTIGEVASVAGLAVRSRLGAFGAPRPYDRVGSAVRLFACQPTTASTARSDTRASTSAATCSGGAPPSTTISRTFADGRGHPMTEIADQALMPAPSLTKLVDRMVADNPVYRRPDPADRRRVVLHLTARGRSLHRRAAGRVHADQAMLLEAIGDDGALMRLLGRLHAAADGQPVVVPVEQRN